MSNLSFYHCKRLGLVSILAFLLAGCVPPETREPAAPINDKPVNSVTNANIDSRPEANAAPAARVALTLPLLDALLGDDAFVSEAKNSVQLSEQELQKLRDTARDAVLKLSDDAADDDSRSTKAAAAEAGKYLNEVLGTERSARFTALVDLYAGGDVSELSPNQVPTDTRVVVNAPAYRMDIFDKGKLVKSYKIGIGYPEFPLPTGLRKAQAIIVNPTWTPPDEPWVKGKIEPGRKVEAGSKLNPLGPIKIPIGSPSLIHGGKSPDRLGTFASHGCVGLTNSQIEDFASRLAGLAGVQLSLADIKMYEKAKTETKEIKLGETLPVELRYETIVLENGTLKIYRDVYEKGTNTEENLRRVLEAYDVSLDDLQPQVRAQLLAGLQQMAMDASGQAVARESSVDQDQRLDKRSTKTSESGRVTKNIKGKKELTFMISQLTGKGYPAPVGMKL